MKSKTTSAIDIPLRAWRASRDWPQRTVARKLGITQSAVAHHEAAGIAGAKLAGRYARIYGTDLAGLMRGPKRMKR